MIPLCPVHLKVIQGVHLIRCYQVKTYGQNELCFNVFRPIAICERFNTSHNNILLYQLNL